MLNAISLFVYSLLVPVRLICNKSDIAVLVALHIAANHFYFFGLC